MFVCGECTNFYNYQRFVIYLKSQVIMAPTMYTCHLPTIRAVHHFPLKEIKVLSERAVFCAGDMWKLMYHLRVTGQAAGSLCVSTPPAALTVIKLPDQDCISKAVYH